MSTNGNGQRETLQEIEDELRDRFPGPEHTHELLLHVAARTELYHRAVDELVVDKLEHREQHRHLPCETGSGCPRLQTAEQRISQLEGGSE